MKIVVTFTTDNTAFEDPEEVHRVLGRAASIVEEVRPDADPGDSEWLHDSDGKRVGFVEWR